MKWYGKIKYNRVRCGCIGETKVGILYTAIRVGLFEKMGIEQTFEGSGGEELSSCRGQPLQGPKVKAYLKYSKVTLTESAQRRIEEKMLEVL